MSRGFRDADTTQQISVQEADEAIQRVRSATESQAQHAAELRSRGAYGVCESCGAPIGEERLSAVPEATRCISCQASWEASRSAG
jgi:RNA polymerase-binding transcription factor